jgi:large subunit ribosomal protein L3
MVEALLGKKIGMTQVFTESGESIPVTAIEIGPNYVTQIKTPERDGYSAVQLGYDEARRINKPELGHLKRLRDVHGRVPALRYLREVKLLGEEVPTIGQIFDVSLFSKGERVDVIGTTKGKGFAGVVKRHGFAGGPKTHGQSDRHRAPGSIGSSTTPGRVLKGTRMAGHMGNVRCTVQNLEIVAVYPERNVLLVKGSIPGARNQLVLVRKAIKQRHAAVGRQR